ncbi:MAG: TPM domain-containing protein [Candidatus Sumerlaeaceae bacterium]
MLQTIAGNRQYTLAEVLGRGRSEMIADAVHDAESCTSGEIVVQIEQELPPGVSARDAAVAQFQRQGIANTKLNNGILLFIALDERKIELVADSGISSRIGQEQWDFVVQIISLGFRTGFPAESIVMALAAMGDLLGCHFPWQPGDVNELPDSPNR